MTAFHHAVVRIERMVEDAWHRVHLPGASHGHWHVSAFAGGAQFPQHVATRASECALPMASALMVAGCLSSTEPTVIYACPTELGGTGGDGSGGGVAAASVEVPEDEPEETIDEAPELDDDPDLPPMAAEPAQAGPRTEAEREAAARRACEANTPWWLRSTRCDPRLTDAIEDYPQEVLPQLRGNWRPYHAPSAPLTPADGPGGFVRPGL